MTTTPMPAPDSFLRRLLPLLLLLVLFLAVEFSYPRFPDNDEVICKSAGHNLGAGRSFSAPELEGFLHFEPPVVRVFFAHPPVYSWLFGQACRYLGFGWKVCVGYDGLISAVLSICVFGLACRVSNMLGAREASRAFLSLVPALLTLLLRQPGRPDELGMVFSYATLWSLSAGPVGIATALLSGFLTGLTLCTSTGVLLGFLPLIAGFWLLHVDRSRWPLLLAFSAAGAVAAAALCLIPLYLIEPTFYRQFFQHANAVVTSPWGRMRGEMGLLVRVAPARILIMIATLPLLFLGLCRSWNTRPRLETLTIYIAPMIGIPSAVLSALRPHLLVVSPAVVPDRRPPCCRAGLAKEEGVESAPGRLAHSVGVGGADLARERIRRPHDATFGSTNFALRRTLAANHSGRRYRPHHKRLVGAGPRPYGARFNLFRDRRPAAHRFFCGRWQRDRDAGKMERTGESSLRGIVAKRIRSHSRRSASRTSIRIFGQRISRSAYGFGSIVLRRTSKPAITPKTGN